MKPLSAIAARIGFGRPKSLLQLQHVLTPDAMKEYVDKQLREAHLRLERLKAEVDVPGHRS